MALAIIPLLIRMACVDPILLFGTNNVATEGIPPLGLYERSIGSRLVLCSRIFYAMFIWMAKLAVSEYLKRLTCASWTNSYERLLRAIRLFLLVTFLAVVIATLAECQPFDHYWQVVPDPGPRCRNGFAQLLTMGICDIITDVLLIAFPIPIIAMSAMPLRNKFTLCFLFSLSTILIAITGYRMSTIIEAHGLQQRRSLWASLEIMAAAAVSNALIIGSFVRDKGVKKAKYKGTERTNSSIVEQQPSINRTMTKRHWGSDSDQDLFSTLRGRLDSFAAEEGKPKVRPAVAVGLDLNRIDSDGHEPVFTSDESLDLDSQGPSTSVAHAQHQQQHEPSLKDVGGLLGSAPSSKPASSHDSSTPLFGQTSGPATHTFAYDFANASNRRGRPVSGQGFSDVGGLLGTPSLNPLQLSRQYSPENTRLRPGSPYDFHTPSRIPLARRPSEASSSDLPSIADVEESVAEKIHPPAGPLPSVMESRDERSRSRNTTRKPWESYELNDAGNLLKDHG